MMIGMQPEVLSGLIGFGGAVLGAVIGGGTSLMATRLTLVHQREQLRETRLADLRHSATESTASELIELSQYLRTVTWDPQSGQEINHWIPGAAAHVRRVRLAMARIPDEAVRERLSVPLDLALEYRAAEVRVAQVLAAWVEWFDEMTQDALNATFAHLRNEEPPPLSDFVLSAQERFAAWTQRREQQFREWQEQDRLRGVQRPTSGEGT
ncbi:hypothetical protein ACIGPN_11590 [Streptomyces afghaniensis]|uniref:hypothetical protein n=1 Tax=Streptomyces TaxID=1883 RepID=UPI00055D87A2|nr:MULTISPECIES: hypothetical protein [Streptomyces]UOB09461.1 hypothetical protein MQE23_10480 [Streptomyces sp. HP-A2021]